MSAERAAVQAETEDKSPSSAETETGFQKRFADYIAQCRADGCPKRKAFGMPKCGGQPAKVMQDEPDQEGGIRMHIACDKGHERVWDFYATAEELKAEAEKVQRRMEEVQKKTARIVITMNIDSEDVAVEHTVPTPKDAIWMLEVAKKHVMNMIGEKGNGRRDGLVLPEKRIVDKSGRPVNLQ